MNAIAEMVNVTTMKENVLIKIMSTIGMMMNMIVKTCDCRTMFEYAIKMMNMNAKMNVIANTMNMI